MSKILAVFINEGELVYIVFKYSHSWWVGWPFEYDRLSQVTVCPINAPLMLSSVDFALSLKSSSDTSALSKAF